jgi:hypothetical protein
MDVTNWVGDWMYDEKKLKAITKERAIEDISIMLTSPDYNNDAVDDAVNLAVKRFGITRAATLLKAKRINAYQMSKV